MKCPACGTDIRPAIGQEIAALTDGGPFAQYRATLRLTMTADVL
jgi:rRNA maturation protein Nop10